jgi:hypothetical protein
MGNQTLQVVVLVAMTTSNNPPNTMALTSLLTYHTVLGLLTIACFICAHNGLVGLFKPPEEELSALDQCDQIKSQKRIKNIYDGDLCSPMA